MTNSLHQLDRRLVDKLLAYGEKKFGDDLYAEADALKTHPGMSPQFLWPWLAYVTPFDERSLADWFLEERGWSLARPAREWLEAQRESWMSVWEITAVDPGRSITLRDQLTFNERTVHEVRASQDVEIHLYVLTRIVDRGPVSLICGMHAQALPPMAGARVVDGVRRTLRRKTAVPPERLRDPKITARMLNLWSDMIDDLRQPPRLQDADGHAVLMTEDRWTFERADRSEIAGRIASIDGMTTDEADDTFVLLKGRSILGDVRLEGTKLIAATMSVERSNALRELVEQACHGLIRSHVRSHSDPFAAARQPAPPPSPSSAEEIELILGMKATHYAKWLDHPLPALDGKTPRDAARTKLGRAQLDIVVKQMEMIESHMPEEERYDFAKLRHALGLGKR